MMNVRAICHACNLHLCPSCPNRVFKTATGLNNHFHREHHRTRSETNSQICQTLITEQHPSPIHPPGIPAYNSFMSISTHTQPTVGLGSETSSTLPNIKNSSTFLLILSGLAICPALPTSQPPTLPMPSGKPPITPYTGSPSTPSYSSSVPSPPTANPSKTASPVASIFSPPATSPPFGMMSLKSPADLPTVAHPLQPLPTPPTNQPKPPLMLTTTVQHMPEPPPTPPSLSSIKPP